MRYARIIFLLLFTVVTTTVNDVYALQAGSKGYSLRLNINSTNEEYQFEQKKGKNLKYSNHLSIEYREINAEGLKKITGIVDELCKLPKFDRKACDDRLEVSCGVKINTKCITKENFDKLKKLIVQFKEVADDEISKGKGK